MAKARPKAVRVTSPSKENIHPAACNGEEETHPAHVGEEVKKENNCVASGAEQNAIMDKRDTPESQPHKDDEVSRQKGCLVSPSEHRALDKKELVGEKIKDQIEVALLEAAAHNAGEHQGCGLLEAQVGAQH